MKGTSMEETVISKGVTFKGSIISETNLIIFGATQGQIEALESVIIESTANVTGDITAKVLIVKGLFEGNADCDTVSIQKGGQFNGNITSRILAIDSKGYFEGKSTPKDRENIPADHEKKLHKEINTDSILL
jgi:cytoskeletal protein CcmA (bactofilin family)